MFLSTSLLTLEIFKCGGSPPPSSEKCGGSVKIRWEPYSVPGPKKINRLGVLPLYFRTIHFVTSIMISNKGQPNIWPFEDKMKSFSKISCAYSFYTQCVDSTQMCESVKCFEISQILCYRIIIPTLDFHCWLLFRYKRNDFYCARGTKHGSNYLGLALHSGRGDIQLTR